jgi:hypothetical protein
MVAVTLPSRAADVRERLVAATAGRVRFLSEEEDA